MSAEVAHGLSTPPIEDSKHKPSKSAKRGAKRASSSLSQEHSTSVIMDGRHKRVWKACERCRMKKTKCDGESPCKRCKEDGLVCTAGSRKKTEYKQLPRGYAEVLENTQYALIATVQKLYSMVRKGETWDLGEPELNDRGLPVIHNIAEKLGCIRASPEFPSAFPEDAEEFAELQRQLAAAESQNGDKSRRKLSADSSFSTNSRSQRASSSESENSHHSHHSQLSKDYNQMMWAQQQQQQQGLTGSAFDQTPTQEIHFQHPFKQGLVHNRQEAVANFEPRTIASPVYTDFQVPRHVESPVFRNTTPFSPWSAGADDFLGPAHMLDLTSMYMRQTRQRNSCPQAISSSTPMVTCMDGLGLDAGLPAAMHAGDAGALLQSMAGTSLNTQAFVGVSTADPLAHYMAGGDGTIRPNMLACNAGFDLADQMDSIMPSDYETHGGTMMP